MGGVGSLWDDLDCLDVEGMGAGGGDGVGVGFGDSDDGFGGGFTTDGGVWIVEFNSSLWSELLSRGKSLEVEGLKYKVDCSPPGFEMGCLWSGE